MFLHEIIVSNIYHCAFSSSNFVSQLAALEENVTHPAVIVAYFDAGSPKVRLNTLKLVQNSDINSIP